MALSLNEASKVIDSALARARELSLRPMCVVILDAGGHVIALKREDGATFFRTQIATAKAWGSLGIGLSSRALGERMADNPGLLIALTAMAGGNLVAMPGGVPIRKDGAVVGAVGVTGDTSDNDEQCALAGIAAAELEAVS